MKWIDVNKKEPPFNEKLLFSKGDNDWDAGTLDEVRLTQSGREMAAIVNGERSDGYKHWARPEPPHQINVTKE